MPDNRASPPDYNEHQVERDLIPKPKPILSENSSKLNKKYLFLILGVVTLSIFSITSYFLIKSLAIKQEKLGQHQEEVPTSQFGQAIENFKPIETQPPTKPANISPTKNQAPSKPNNPTQTDTSYYSMGVLVIKYFPLTTDGVSIDVNVTGDVSDSYNIIRQRTINITSNLIYSLEKASIYLGYKNSSASSSLHYQIVDTKEYKQAVPIKPVSSKPTYPNYYNIMQSHNICDYVENKNVKEVWLYAYQGPNKADGHPYLDIYESKMSGPQGDISNSGRENDMPTCKTTYRVYTFNYGRGTSEALESWGHQMEAELRTVDSTLFGLFQGPNYPPNLGQTGRCGSVHNPPNATEEYDRSNPIPWKSDCLDWNPEGLGTIAEIDCKNWGCEDKGDKNNPSLNYMIWMWENLPGKDNNKTYQGKKLRNWWDVHGDFDNVITKNKRLIN